jgi:general secretion pathway protein M
MKDWFFGLATREQYLVGGGSIVAACIILWALVWTPLKTGTDELSQRLANQEQQLANLYRAQALKQTSGSSPNNTRAGGSMVVVVDQTTRSAGLQAAVTRNQPDGPDGIRVTLKDAQFDAVVRWLADLSSTGVIVETVSVDQTRQAGLVNCTLVLRRS